MCYRSGMAFSMEVAALIGDLLASRVPGWVRSAVLLEAESAPGWRRRGSLSIVGACHDGEDIRGGVLIPVGRKPILKAQPIHPLPFPCNGHVCRVHNVKYIITDNNRNIAFSEDQRSIVGGWHITVLLPLRILRLYGRILKWQDQSQCQLKYKGKKDSTVAGIQKILNFHGMKVPQNDPSLRVLIIPG
ncbi:hypothetical protein GJAV_G00075500 [Gymnothorax javanicus]|nr:hypothetical protein GJAV_G00075500 [Gymnothorax javanicus]